MSQTDTAQTEIDAVAEGIRILGPDVRGYGNVDPAWSRPPAVLVIDCVLSLNTKYDGFVVPRLETFMKNHPGIQKVADLANLMANYPTPHAFMQQVLNYNYEDRANTLQSVVKFVSKIVEKRPNVPEEEVLRQWAIQANPEEYQTLNIRGFGIAGFQYLRMLFGADTTKPDVHIIRFVSNILDRNVSAIEALQLLEASSERLGISVRDVDTYIWQISARPQQDVIDTNYQVARPAIDILNGREYQHVNSSKWPNQEALYAALNIYRDAMRLFIFRNLKKVQGLAKEDRIEKPEDIDINDFPHRFRRHWNEAFKQRFDPDRDVRSAVGIITEARNKVSHPKAEDLPSEYAIRRLHEIADILGQINAPEQKREVEAISAKLDTSTVTPTDDKPKLPPNNDVTENRTVPSGESGGATRPAIDIQTEKHPEVGYSEFWTPIRNGEFGELFAGIPVLIRNEGFISKIIRGVEVCLNLNAHQCYIRLWLYGENRSERRDKIKELFQESIYDCEDKDTPKGATLIFPVMNKGKNDRDDWDEIREKLVNMGTDIYNKINESDL